MRCGWKAFLRATVVTVAVLANASVAQAAAPVINELSPEIGQSSATTVVTIKGEGFLAANTICEGAACAALVEVSFGGDAAQVISGSPEELRVKVPPHAPGSVTVSVKPAKGEPVELPSAFTFIRPPPSPTITAPTPGSATSANMQLVTGEVGVEPWDEQQVIVTLYQGASEGIPLETRSFAVSGGRWSTAFGPLAPGTYAVRAYQFGELGSRGHSALVTFTVLANVPPGAGGGGPHANPPPTASFSWFPSSPKTGEPVSLFSSSKDAASPITAFAWALASTSVFQPAGPIYTTSFSTPGAHVVRLRVISADGLSSIATETITVGSLEASLMQPFPVVRIAGTDSAFGARLSLLSVLAPSGAQVTVRCKGRGCPLRRARRIVPSTRRGIGTVTFPQFDRVLPAGVKLIVRVYKAGEIGKYTRFVIRHGKLPKRIDTCLDPAGVKPVACPS
jgi:hypothetical protein